MAIICSLNIEAIIIHKILTNIWIFYNLVLLYVIGTSQNIVLNLKIHKIMKHIIAVLFAIILVSCNNQKEDKIDYGSNQAVGKYADVNDIKIYYETYGEGEPLLLLHGNGGSIEGFINQIPELSKHFKVIAVDSRAQGRTTDSDQEITYALMASDMATLIDKLNLGKVNVVGWSDGGIIGLELAYAYPEKVLKVVTFGVTRPEIALQFFG